MMSLKYRVALVDYDEDLFTPQGWEGEALAEAGAIWVIGQNRTAESAWEASRDADVVMVQSVRRLLTRDVIERLKNCRGIVRVGIGHDNVDQDACTEMGIALCNVPEYCVHEVADHAIALLLGSARHLARQDRQIRSGVWDRAGARPARRLSGQTLGLIGFGRVARALVEKARGMEFKVLAFDPFVSEETARSCGAELVSLDDLLARSDLISVHAPLTRETYHLLGEREFRLTKPGAIIVNTSRGPVIDQSALAAALREGRIAAAGLDVFENEPLAQDEPLLQMDTITMSPHVAAYSEEAVRDLYLSACRTAIDMLRGVWPATAVNPAARSAWEERWSRRNRTELTDG